MKIRFRMPVGRRARAKAGFTLPEIVISMLILSVGAAGLMGCFTFGFFGMQMARENQRATQIILERMEAIRLCSWDQINTPGFVPTAIPPEYYDPTGPIGAQGVMYTGTVAIEDFDHSTAYATNMKKITITLQWASRGLTRTRSSATYVAKDGVQNYVY